IYRLSVLFICQYTRYRIFVKLFGDNFYLYLVIPVKTGTCLSADRSRVLLLCSGSPHKNCGGMTKAYTRTLTPPAGGVSVRACNFSLITINLLYMTLQ